MSISEVAVDFGILLKGGNPIRKYASGETIFERGDEGKELFVIKSGIVEIVLRDGSVVSLPEGTIFGEMSLIDPAPRSATARAQTEVELATMDERQFVFYVSHVPYFALNIMRVLTRRLRGNSTEN
jgi:CRP-like cAMP-binding protein